LALILHIETATPVCSVALSENDQVLALRESLEGKNHSLLLTRFIEEVLRETGATFSALSAVAVSRGPGSYTGLRIGVSTAKGLSYGLSVPLISVGTLASMTAGISPGYAKSGNNHELLFCPMIDARRMEVYSALYQHDGRVVQDVSAVVVTPETFTPLLGKYRIVFFGDGAGKCREYLNHPNAIIDENFKISAKYMCLPAWKKFGEKRFENVAYFEPFYLKDFIATIPKNKML
jgi:tRNA threonylcarbamoyladenosine biosynthesis protein TsaB